MISEIVVLLAFLCFLAVRSDRVHRPWAFLVAATSWGTARILVEVSFKGGSYEYSWGSLPSVVAAACLYLCVVFLFVACVGRPRGVPPVTPGSGAEAKGEVAAVPAAPSERIRMILDEQG
jgi:hypothetical protein